MDKICTEIFPCFFFVLSSPFLTHGHREEVLSVSSFLKQERSKRLRPGAVSIWRPKFPVQPVDMQTGRVDILEIFGTNGRPSELLHFFRSQTGWTEIAISVLLSSCPIT